MGKEQHSSRLNITEIIQPLAWSSKLISLPQFSKHIKNFFYFNWFKLVCPSLPVLHQIMPHSYNLILMHLTFYYYCKIQGFSIFIRMLTIYWKCFWWEIRFFTKQNSFWQEEMDRNRICTKTYTCFEKRFTISWADISVRSPKRWNILQN